MAASLPPSPPLPGARLRGEQWPGLRLEEEAAAAARALASRPLSRLRVVTWNVWFDDACAAKRQAALLQEVLSAAPDVACLQEVLPAFAEAVRDCEALMAVYQASPQGVRPYGCMLLVRRDLQPTFGAQPLPSRMARSLLWARCGGRCPGLMVATTHLESLDSAPARRRQLEDAARLLREHEGAVLCGDFNFDDERTWGDWRLPRPALGPEALENRVLGEVLPDFADAWREVRPEERGYTFDGTENPICIRDQGERMRYDRLMARRGPGGLVPVAAELLGTGPIDSRGMRPSDHYGLLVDLERHDGRADRAPLVARTDPAPAADSPRTPPSRAPARPPSPGPAPGGQPPSAAGAGAPR